MEEEEREEQVMSEVHLGCPPHLSGPYVSHFTVCLPATHCSDHLQTGVLSREMLSLSAPNRHPQKIQKISSTEQNDPESSYHPPLEDMSHEFFNMDEDGDLVLTRRKNPNNRCLNFGLTIQHNITSSLLEVGLQVWKAALVLTDFIFHKSFTSTDLNDVIAIDLGAGTGLVGIALARVAKTVFITDKGVHILDNCDTNTHLNSSLLKFQENSVRIRELDWKDSWPPNMAVNFPSRDRLPKSRYLWNPLEIEEAESATVLLAADVIYSDELTDSFFSMLEKLMSRGSEKVLYLALEKRYNFSLDELDVVANGYSYFRCFFDDGDHGKDNNGMLPRFLGKQIDLTVIPQYIKEYDRGKDLEMWKITYCRKLNVDNSASS
ncbi:methyltransferase-like protein 22 isoform X1 [Canna indica]|uniref:Methyltransferase-like protein 22 isoform X1 n=1 Tax=Canna indica TaxID=4628 RepID=A0AAQ3KZ48_9LILI|nr:methyltransferase-like protein 22 isoform X1 [Canna indica]